MPSTPTTSPRDKNAAHSPFRISHSAFRISSRPAFTIMELLVVVAIIILLVAILIPAISASRRVANKSANTAQLSSIQSGLQQYYTDFNMYPPSSNLIPPAETTKVYNAIQPNRGPAMLAEALMGYLQGGTAATPGSGDGAGPPDFPSDPRFGFRTRTGGLGKIYGPYVSDDPKSFKVNLPLAAGNPTTDAAFIDIFGHEILYFASTRQGVTTSSTIIAPTQIFGPLPVAGQPLNTAIGYFIDTDNKFDCNGNALLYADGSPAPLPSATIPPPAANKGPTTLFFQNLANRSSNDLTKGSGPVMGANSFLLICQGEDGNPYTDDDILATNR